MTLNPMYCDGFVEDIWGNRTEQTWEYRHTCGTFCWEMYDSAYCPEHRYFLQGMPEEWVAEMDSYWKERR